MTLDLIGRNSYTFQKMKDKMTREYEKENKEINDKVYSKV